MCLYLLTSTNYFISNIWYKILVLLRWLSFFIRQFNTSCITKSHYSDHMDLSTLTSDQGILKRLKPSIPTFMGNEFITFCTVWVRYLLLNFGPHKGHDPLKAKRGYKTVFRDWIINATLSMWLMQQCFIAMIKVLKLRF